MTTAVVTLILTIIITEFIPQVHIYVVTSLQLQHNQNASMMASHQTRQTASRNKFISDHRYVLYIKRKGSCSRLVQFLSAWDGDSMTLIQCYRWLTYRKTKSHSIASTGVVCSAECIDRAMPGMEYASSSITFVVSKYIQWNLYIETTLGTNKMWSLYTGGLYMQVQ